MFLHIEPATHTSFIDPHAQTSCKLGLWHQELLFDIIHVSAPEIIFQAKFCSHYGN